MGVIIECEASADTICIMNAGTQFCEDSPLNLKAQHGKFYTVTVKVLDKTAQAAENGGTADANLIADQADSTNNEVHVDENDFNRLFPHSQLQYTFSAGLHKHMFFNIPKESVQLSELFAQLDGLKKENKLAECIVNTASLEQIFMQIALQAEYSIKADTPFSMPQVV